MLNSIHWLTAGKSSDNIELLLNSNLASVRMRAAVACQVFKNNKIKTFIGDSVAANTESIIVGKTGTNEERIKYWLNQIESFKKKGVRIYLDYTDNHLGFESPMREYYRILINICDHVIVNSCQMEQNIKQYWRGRISIIPDIVEVKIKPPKKNINKIPHIFWFGHASNINYLIDYLKLTNFTKQAQIHMSVMSNQIGLDIFKKEINLRSTNIDLVNWSLESMESIGKMADIALIPSSTVDPKKSGVSNNRLLTSLALGLPTLATPMHSYKQFDKYFLDIDKYNIDDIFQDIEKQKFLVAEAQDVVINKYSKENIGKQWLELII